MILGKYVANQLSLFINGIKIERTSEVVLLGITIDDQLTFKTHIEYICRMAKYKLRGLQRIRNYLSTEKASLRFRIIIFFNEVLFTSYCCVR